MVTMLQTLGKKTRNRVLAALSPALLDRLQAHLSSVDLPQGVVLVQPNVPIEWLYFLDRGMASVTSTDRSGTIVEVGIIGREGLIGVQALIGQSRTDTTVVMQGSGDGLSIRASVFKQLVFDRESPAVLYPFLFALLEQTMQLVLCNRLHSLEARLARWLLMASDVLESSTLALTQEFLAQMLGSSRPGVTLSAGNLQRIGLIVYNRGHVHILQREQLEAIACECYPAIRRAYAEAYPAVSE